MKPENKTARCMYCDTSFYASDLKITMLRKWNNVRHDRCEYQCPACGYITTSFLFPVEEA